MLALFLVSVFALNSCQDDMDDVDVPVYDFIWKGMNLYYLWKDNVPDLDDNRFANQQDLNDYLRGFNTPTDLFESLLYRKDAQNVVQDRFSVIFEDYRILENALQGVAKSNGIDFALVYKDESETSIIGYVRYVLPNSDASAKDIQRGDIFYAVNGVELTPENYQGLLNSDSYTLSLADFNEGAFTPNGREVFLTKSEYAENPVYNVNVINQGAHTIGYLMYNGFYSNYDTELNNAFGQLAGQGVTDLVLDLRYNSGGSVRTATYLASMITGQFTGQLFAREQWNARLQAYYEKENPDALKDLFAGELSNGAGINHLNLNTVYILTTRSTASASELVINCLKPYINVVVIGETTTGKNVGSVTLYDSDDFSRNGRSNEHTYAMQPIVLKVVDKNGFGDYAAGIPADFRAREDLGNLGILGDPSEPFFFKAIAIITSQGRFGNSEPDKVYKQFKDSKNMRRFGTEMYRDEAPANATGLIKGLE